MDEKEITIPWEVSEFKDFKRTTVINSSFAEFLADMGFRNAFIFNSYEYVLIQENQIHFVNKQQIVQTFLKWLNDNFDKYSSEGETLYDVKKSFANKIRALISNEVLSLLPILEVTAHFDTKDECYFYLKNTAVRITEEDILLVNYDKINGYVFTEQITDKNFKLPVGELLELDIPFRKFVHNIANNQPERINAFESLIGYMLHRYRNPSINKAVVILDENINELDSVMGGTGKSLFVRAISYLRPSVNIDGKGFRNSDSFAFQRVTPFTSIVSINDIQQNADFESFYGRITDGFSINQKYKKEVFIPLERSPKLIITSNYYPKAPSGNSTERRRYVIEVSQHYNKNFTVEDEFNHFFFSDWNEEQWNNFIYYMLTCVQKFLKNGLVQADEINLTQRRLISEVGIELMEFMDEQLLTQTKLHKKELFTNFIRGNYVPSKYQPTQKSFTVKVKKYFEYKNISYRETPANTKVYYEIIPENSKLQPLTIKDIKSEYQMVKTPLQMKRLVVKMKEHFGDTKNKVLAVDLETTGLDCFLDEIECIALCFEKGTGYNIIFPKDKNKALVFIKPVIPFLKSNKIIKVFHNAKFDLKFFVKYGIELDGEIHDTMILDHLLNPNRKTHGLKEISEIHLNYKQISYKEMTDRRAKNKSPLEELTKYACEDVDLTFQLYHFINNQLNKK